MGVLKPGGVQRHVAMDTVTDGAWWAIKCAKWAVVTNSRLTQTHTCAREVGVCVGAGESMSCNARLWAGSHLYFLTKGCRWAELSEWVSGLMDELLSE